MLVEIEQQPVGLVLDHIDEAADGRRDDRQPTTQRLENRDTQTFALSRMHQTVEIRQQCLEIAPEAGKPNVPGEPQFGFVSKH